MELEMVIQNLGMFSSLKINIFYTWTKDQNATKKK